MGEEAKGSCWVAGNPDECVCDHPIVIISLFCWFPDRHVDVYVFLSLTLSIDVSLFLFPFIFRQYFCTIVPALIIFRDSQRRDP